MCTPSHHASPPAKTPPLGFSSLGKGQLGRMMMEAAGSTYPVSLSLGWLPMGAGRSISCVNLYFNRAAPLSLTRTVLSHLLNNQPPILSILAVSSTLLLLLLHLFNVTCLWCRVAPQCFSCFMYFTLEMFDIH